jgi:hypothetical protein
MNQLVSREIVVFNSVSFVSFQSALPPRATAVNLSTFVTGLAVLGSEAAHDAITISTS